MSWTHNTTQRAVSPASTNETPYLLFYMRADTVPHDTSEAAEVLSSIPVSLRDEVQADNRATHPAVGTSPGDPVSDGRPGDARVDFSRSPTAAGRNNPVDQIQRICGQKRKLEFQDSALGPEHDKTFTVHVLVDGDRVASASGRRLKPTKRAAARSALAVMADWQVRSGVRLCIRALTDMHAHSDAPYHPRATNLTRRWCVVRNNPSEGVRKTLRRVTRIFRTDPCPWTRPTVRPPGRKSTGGLPSHPVGIFLRSRNGHRWGNASGMPRRLETASPWTTRHMMLPLPVVDQRIRGRRYRVGHRRQWLTMGGKLYGESYNSPVTSSRTDGVPIAVLDCLNS